MIYRRLDSDWDYTFGNGVGCYLSDLEAVAQAVKSRLLLFLEEWWMDKTDGLPMWQFILGVPGSGNMKDVIDRLIVDRMLATTWNNVSLVPSVESISSEYDPNTRSYEFTARINTCFGSVTISSVPFDSGVGL